jgi:alkanesulfonate monooxygenase SsuD/methylene tetrahydromethanopterin reductase-like flavin-dependent oxidoreductase (luciferase family)
MIKTWIFEFFPELTDALAQDTGLSAPAYFQKYLDLWVRDEKLGFEGIFFSEHHFGNSFSPSPNLLIAALAGRTSALRLGVMGVVVPYYTPARIIEEIGMLDQLTNGRLEIGTAIGVPQELARVNLDMASARPIMEESLAIIDQALDHGGIVNFHGNVFQYDNLRLVPRPVQQPAPPKWSTVTSADSARRAVHRRSKICTGFNSVAEVKALFDAYRHEAETISYNVDHEHLGLRRRVVVSDSESHAAELSDAALERFKGFVAKDPRLVKSHVPDAPNKESGFAISTDEFISGTPEQVAENIIEQCRHTGAGHFLAVLHWSAGLAEVSSAHELMGAKVLPILKKAGLPARPH